MNVLKKKRNLLITLCITTMLICTAVLFGAAALPDAKNIAYAATEGVDCAALTYVATDSGAAYSVSGIDNANDYNNTNSNNLKIVIPATYDGKPVTAIADNAFYYSVNYTITSLSFSNATNLKTIGEKAFYESVGLKGELVIPDSVTTIGKNAFSQCGLTGALTIPSSVESIGENAFELCKGFTSLVFQENSKLTMINASVFRNCEGLEGALSIPDSVTAIGNYAFTYCKGITSLKLPKNVGFNTIGDYAFNYCSSLTGALIIPDSVTTIGNKAFYNCTRITSLKLPENANFTTIGDSAFEYCSSLTGALIIPDSVTTIGNKAFQVANIQTCYLPKNATFGSQCLNKAQIIVAKNKTQYDSCKAAFLADNASAVVTYETTVTFDANDGGNIDGTQQVTQTKLFDGMFSAEKNETTKVWTLNSDTYAFPLATKLGYKWKSYNTSKAGNGTTLQLLGTVTDAPTYYAQYSSVALESISAQFNQGETKVFTSSTLDSLKNMLTVTGLNNDGSAYSETIDYTLSGTLAAGTSTVTATFNGKTATFNVTVTAVALESISATFNQGETKIYTSSTLDSLKSMLTVTGLNNDGSAYSETIDYTLSGLLTAGTSTVTATFNGKADTFEVTVTAVELASISATFSQGETKIYTSSTLDSLKSMLTVTGLNNDGSAYSETIDYTLSGSLTAGTSTVTATFNGKTATFEVTVTAVALESISATFSQGETKIYTSATLDSLKSYLTVTGLNNDGSAYTSAIEYTLTGTLTAGTSTVTATFNGKADTFEVTVTAVELASISATFSQGETKIYTSATLDSLKSYLTVTGLNNDGSAYTSAIEYTLTGTLTAGTSTVTATFNGKADTFEVTVTAVELASISATFTQNGTKIYTSNSLDSLKNMLTVTGKNNDGSAYTSAIAYTLEGTLTVGESTIAVKFGGKNATFNVTVTAKVLESLAITTNPNKTVYTAFENFDKTGMVVTATFSHGTETISNFTVMGAADLQVGTTSLTISYTSGVITKTATVSITVNKILLEKPTASGNYTYNGNAQTVTLDGFDEKTMEISGNTQTNANTYDVVVTLSDKANYAWKDNTIIGVTQNWTIEKATYNISGISFTDKTVKENGNEHTLTLTGTLPSGVTVTYSGTNGYIQGGISLAGIYEITATFAVTDSDNYNMPEPMTATLTVNLAEITGTDSSSGSTVIITDGGNGIKPGTTVTVKEKPAADYKDADITLADKKQTVLQANDISLVYNGVTIQPDGSVTVRLLIKENLRGYEGLKVVYIAPNGAIQDMNATRDGDYLVFSTTHFSLYAIVAPSIEKTVTPGNELSGGVIACIVVASILVVLMLILLILFLLRKDKSQGFRAYCAGLFKKSGKKNAENKTSDTKTEDETIKIDNNENTKTDDDSKE